MKNLFLLLVFGLSVGVATAQTIPSPDVNETRYDRGKIFLGLNTVGLSLGYGGKGMGFLGSFSVNPRFGYFPAKNFLIGIQQNSQLDLISSDYNEYAFTTGVFARGYFFGSKRFSPFIESGWNYGIYLNEFKDNDNIVLYKAGGFRTGIGISFNPKKLSRLSVEFGIYADYVPQKLSDNPLLKPSLGIHFSF